MPESSLLSVVILTANRLPALQRCLESVAGQGYPFLEVVIVENGSSDGTRGWLKSQTIVPNLRVVTGDPAASFAEARNRGASVSIGDGLVFIDDDCVASAGWLDRIAAHLRSAMQWGLCVAPAEFRFPRWWHPTLNWTVGLSGPEHEDPELAGSLAYPQTANMALRREVWRHEPFQAIGGHLDGSAGIYQWGREDAELWRRLRLRGYRTRFDPELIVTHHIDPSRLRWSYVNRRAALDGSSLWHRERDLTYLKRGLGDLLAYPGRVASMPFRTPPNRWLNQVALETLWRKRQFAL